MIGESGRDSVWGMGHKRHELSRRNGTSQGVRHRPPKAAASVHGTHGPSPWNLRPRFHRS